MGASQKSTAAGPTMAEQADRHELYQASVQNPEFEIDFMVWHGHLFGGMDQTPAQQHSGIGRQRS